ncbi:hypothetical protein RHMOL_Rhmol09G0060600 [Rhododendron molle]|uniref:Uncharacterized protein n=1 Tax=Rhododendron molle TaxID=49168 RepID=A0ACC0MBG0_RHOML|nr:hypothetical protein RHMOL_Rhmol09G0060600 [Rhododendron molle]
MKDGVGNWLHDLEDIKDHIVCNFDNLFSTDRVHENWNTGLELSASVDISPARTTLAPCLIWRKFALFSINLNLGKRLALMGFTRGFSNALGVLL